MTVYQATQSPPAVQPRKRGGKLKPRTCARGRVTFRSLQKLKLNKSRCDPAVPGLYYQHQPGKGSGRSALYAKFRWTDPVTKKRQYLSLGRLPTEEELEAQRKACADMVGQPVGLWLDCELELEKFREQARKARGKLLGGLNPRSDVGSEGRTLGQAKDLHVADMQKRGKSPLSIAEYELAARHLKDWLSVPLRRITGEMVRERHQKLGKKVGKGAANKTMRAFRAFYNSAHALDPTLPPNPTVALKRAWFTLPARKSALRTRDLAKFGCELGALRREGKFGELRADYFALMLLTGMRRTALANVRREHVDPVTRAIHVPAPKGGEARAFTLPLSDAAWEIVKRRLEASNSPWLFPSPLDPAKSISDVRADGAFSDWADASGKPVAFTRHGLRATFIGAGHAAGVSDRYVQLLANHKLHKGDVHGGYVSEDDLEALRAATQRITDYMRKHGLPL